MKSANSKLLLEPYKSDGAIKTQINKGFATTKQKSTLVGLRAIVEGTIYNRDGSVMTTVSPGDFVFFKEEDLHTQSWSKTVFNCEAVEEPFIIAESTAAIMVKNGNN